MSFKCPSCGVELEVSLRGGDRPSEAWRSVPLGELKLPNRAYHALKTPRWDGTAWVEDGPKTAGDIDDMSDNELLGYSNFGRVSLRAVREVLEGLKANGF